MAQTAQMVSFQSGNRQLEGFVGKGAGVFWGAYRGEGGGVSRLNVPIHT